MFFIHQDVNDTVCTEIFLIAHKVPNSSRGRPSVKSSQNFEEIFIARHSPKPLNVQNPALQTARACNLLEVSRCLLSSDSGKMALRTIPDSSSNWCI
jgi:hypothetical protein